MINSENSIFKLYFSFDTETLIRQKKNTNEYIQQNLTHEKKHSTNILLYWSNYCMGNY